MEKANIMAMPAFSHHPPVLPTEQDIRLAQESSRTLASLLDKNEMLHLQTANRDVELILPASAVRLLLDILTNMSAGNAITLIPIHAELTTQQAADLLNVSRQFLIDDLLEKGQIPFRKVGTHRRILFRDLMEYKQAHEAKRRVTLAELAAHDQSLGLD
jgi:excisionase family DNA binding protein